MARWSWRAVLTCRVTLRGRVQRNGDYDAGAEHQCHVSSPSARLSTQNVTDIREGLSCEG